LVKQGRSLPVNFEEIYQKANKRFKDALSLQQRIQQTFKTNKTRQTGGGSGADSTNKVAGLYQEALNLSLLEQVKEMRILFKEAEELSDLI